MYIKCSHVLKLITLVTNLVLSEHMMYHSMVRHRSSALPYGVLCGDVERKTKLCPGAPCCAVRLSLVLSVRCWAVLRRLMMLLHIYLFMTLCMHSVSKPYLVHTEDRGTINDQLGSTRIVE